MSNVFETLLHQQHLAEDLEWRKRRLDWEEEQQKREEEIHEMRRKESRQQEQLSMIL
jgi:hypothetical protein